MTSVERHGVAALLFANEGLDARLEVLRNASGFLGGAYFKPVKPFGERLAYTRWTDHVSATAAFDVGDAATFRATPVETMSVRLKATPDDFDGILPLDRIGSTFLVVRFALDPARGEAFLDELNRSTDEYLPNFSPVRAVVFHQSADKSLIVEMISITSAWRMKLLQLTPELRRHQRAVAAKARTSVAEVYRLARTIAPGSGSQ